MLLWCVFTLCRELAETLTNAHFLFSLIILRWQLVVQHVQYSLECWKWEQHNSLVLDVTTVNMHLLSEAMCILFYFNIIREGSSAAEHKGNIAGAKLRKTEKKKLSLSFKETCDSYQKIGAADSSVYRLYLSSLQNRLRSALKDKNLNSSAFLLICTVIRLCSPEGCTMQRGILLIQVTSGITLWCGVQLPD